MEPINEQSTQTQHTRRDIKINSSTLSQQNQQQRMDSPVLMPKVPEEKKKELEFELEVEIKSLKVKGKSYAVEELKGSHDLTFKNVKDLLACVKTDFTEKIIQIFVENSQ